MTLVPDEPATPTHRYLAGAIDREAWFEVEACPVVELAAEPDAVLALAEALGTAAADMWLDGRFKVGPGAPPRSPRRRAALRSV